MAMNTSSWYNLFVNESGHRSQLLLLIGIQNGEKQLNEKVAQLLVAIRLSLLRGILAENRWDHRKEAQAIVDLIRRENSTVHSLLDRPLHSLQLWCLGLAISPLLHILLQPSPSCKIDL